MKSQKEGSSRNCELGEMSGQACRDWGDVKVNHVKASVKSQEILSGKSHMLWEVKYT